MTIETKTASMTIREFSSWARLGHTKIYELIGSGELPAIKVGRRTYIRTAEAEAWLEACPHYPAIPGRTVA